MKAYQYFIGKGHKQHFSSAPCIELLGAEGRLESRWKSKTGNCFVTRCLGFVLQALISVHGCSVTLQLTIHRHEHTTTLSLTHIHAVHGSGTREVAEKDKVMCHYQLPLGYYSQTTGKAELRQAEGEIAKLRL